MVEQTPGSLPDNLDAKFEQYPVKQTIPSRDLPLTDYQIFINHHRQI